MKKMFCKECCKVTYVVEKKTSPRESGTLYETRCFPSKHLVGFRLDQSETLS